MKTIWAAVLASLAVSASARLSNAPTEVAPIGDTTWANDGTRSSIMGGLKPFFGNAQGKYIDFHDMNLSAEYKESLYNQFSSVYSGVPGPSSVLMDGNRLTLASTPHDASQLAMVVTSGTSNTIVAAALLHYFCGKYNGATPPKGKQNCDQRPTLTIFYSGNVIPNRELSNELIGWTKSYLKDKNRFMGGAAAVRNFVPQIRHLS